MRQNRVRNPPRRHPNHILAAYLAPAHVRSRSRRPGNSHTVAQTIEPDSPRQE